MVAAQRRAGSSPRQNGRRSPERVGDGLHAQRRAGSSPRQNPVKMPGYWPSPYVAQRRAGSSPRQNQAAHGGRGTALGSLNEGRGVVPAKTHEQDGTASQFGGESLNEGRGVVPAKTLPSDRFSKSPEDAQRRAGSSPRQNQHLSPSRE